MEHRFNLGDRLLGKKRVVVSLLGLLGLCCPSSLLAEKLDTTFVLDMVIDTTPCYYTKYNDKGQIVEYGRYKNQNDIFSKPAFRFNTGYVTNERGDTLDTLYYTCDRVTKQWEEKAFIGSYSPKFHDNGMISSFYHTDYTDYTIYGEWGMPMSVTVPSESIEYTIGGNGYTREYTYTTYDVGGMHHANIGEITTEESCDSLGNNDAYSNFYDDRGNLISSVQYYNHRYEYTYDSLDRRIKTTHYDSTIVKDSTVYIYGHALHEGEPVLLSVLYYGTPIDSFSLEQFHYDFSESLIYGDLSFVLPYGSTSEESYDAGTGILTLIVKGKDFAHDTTNANTYTFVLKKAESFITEMTFQGIPVEGFSPEKYVYDDFEGLYLLGFGSGRLKLTDGNEEISYWDYETSAGAIISANHYDEQTGVLTTTIAGADYDVNPTNTHTYTFVTKKIDAYISSLKINGNDFEGFSPDKYDYEMPLDYTWDDDSPSSLIDRDFDISVYPKFLSVDKSYDDSTHTLICSIYKNSTIYNTYRFHFLPTDGVDDFLGDQVNLYVTDRTICVDGATEPISVYDLLGTLVGISRGEEARIPVSQAGVYVVKAGGKAAKVVVK